MGWLEVKGISQLQLIMPILGHDLVDRMNCAMIPRDSKDSSDNLKSLPSTPYHWVREVVAG